MRKLFLTTILFLMICSLSFACEHPTIIQKEDGKLEWCKICGEILYEDYDCETTITFVLDKMRCEYKGKTYINFTYAIKKVLEEIELEKLSLNADSKYSK